MSVEGTAQREWSTFGRITCGKAVIAKYHSSVRQIRIVTAPVWNPDYRINRQALVFFALCLLPIYAVGDHYQHARQGAGGMVSVGLLLLTIKFHWNSRHNAWFWIGLSLCAFAQIPFVTLFPSLNHKATLATMYPMAMLDYVVIYLVLRTAFLLATKLYAKTNATAQ